VLKVFKALSGFKVPLAHLGRKVYRVQLAFKVL
jgi:hypothetical protein